MDFERALRELVAQIPRGRVGRCGDLAAALGDPVAARAVHHVAKSRGRPWTGIRRVVTADGRSVSSGAVVRGSPFTDFRGGGLLTRLRREQLRLAARNVLEDLVGDSATATGVDVAYGEGQAFAAAVTWDHDAQEYVERASVACPETFPYIPGYLAAREFPPARAALRKLRHRTEVLLVDGHGILHPARFGFACYLGVRLGVPSVGVAKSPLTPEARRVTARAGEVVPILVADKLRGFCWRPSRSRPIYVSPGHAVSAERALAIVRRNTTGRIPLPLLEAHRFATELKRMKTKRGK